MNVTIKDVVDFYIQHPEEIGNLNVLTRYGYKKIEYADITAYDSEIYEIILENGFSVKTSPEHLLWVNNYWKKVNEIKIGDECYHKEGKSKVKFIKILDYKEDLYDLQVEEVHEFFADNFVSHNSTILDALTFVLFGKSFRKVNKPQLLNTITRKDMVVEIEFIIGTSEYKIIRGIKPTIFEVYQNNKLLNQSAESKDYQEILEKQILKVNYKSFCQVVVLGSATFQPFMQLTTGQRREVIEDLLDLEIFTTMNSLLKNKIMLNGQDINSKISEKKVIEEKIKLIKEHIKQIENNNSIIKDDKKNRITETKEKIQKLQNEIITIENEIESLLNKIIDETKIKTKASKLNKLRNEIKTNLSYLNKEIEFFENNDDCPTCKQTIESNYKNNVVKEKSIKINEINDGLIKLNETYDELEEKILQIEKINSKISNLKLEKHKTSLNVSSLENYIKELERDIENINIVVNNDNENKIKDLDEELENNKKQYSKLIEEKETLSSASILLKDGGIKAKIIKQYVPIINKLINKYLASLDFFVQFELDEEFNEKIKSRYRDEFSYSSFSEGEKMKINLAILFAWRSVAKLRNSINTNLLIMDEVFDSSLDSNGTDEFLKLLNNLTIDTNVFIISHKKDQLLEKFDNIIRFEKKKNFSRIIKG